MARLPINNRKWVLLRIPFHRKNFFLECKVGLNKNQNFKYIGLKYNLALANGWNVRHFIRVSRQKKKGQYAREQSREEKTLTASFTEVLNPELKARKIGGLLAKSQLKSLHYIKPSS